MIKLKHSVAVFCLAFSGISAQVKDTLAEKMMVYQLPNGGWGKHNSDKKNVLNLQTIQLAEKERFKKHI